MLDDPKQERNCAWQEIQLQHIFKQAYLKGISDSQS